MRETYRNQIFFVLLMVVVGLTVFTGCRQTTKPTANKPKAVAKKPAPKAPEVKKETTDTVADNERVIIETDKGKMVLELYPDVAPKTVENFRKLISKGFYNGLTFHRVVPGFVVQGGDPDGDGTGGPGYMIPAEFNDKKHLRGTLAMARSADPDSAGSQFYICLAPQPRLDGQYTVFGQVVEGVETIDSITVGDKMNRVYLEPTKPD